jgi:hypothetical protein
VCRIPYPLEFAASELDDACFLVYGDVVLFIPILELLNVGLRLRLEEIQATCTVQVVAEVPGIQPVVSMKVETTSGTLTVQ